MPRDAREAFEGVKQGLSRFAEPARSVASLGQTVQDTVSDYTPTTLGDTVRRFIGAGGSDKRTKDIELPNRSGKVDPRLTRPTSRNPLKRLGQSVRQLSARSR